MDYDDIGSCDPIRRVKDLYESNQVNLNGEQMEPNDVAFPCGLIAKYMFNDTF